MNQPRFSILIPTYNREALLKETIDSVLAQTYPNFEVIVIDNGSTDGTQEMLSQYGSRIVLLTESRRGADIARSTGVSFSSGEYFVLLDSDDLLFPNALEIYDRIIENLGAPALIIGAMAWFADGESPPPKPGSSDPIAYRLFKDFLSKDIGVGKSCSILVIKRSAAEATNALRAEPSIIAVHDSNHLLLVGTAGPTVIIDRPCTVCYRIHAENISRDSGSVARLVDGILALVDNERRGRYPGGKARSFDRHAFLGGCSLPVVRWALRKGQIRAALKLALATGSMIAAAILNKLRRHFRKTTPVHLLEVKTEAGDR